MENQNNCWLYAGYFSTKGYGLIWNNTLQKFEKAHRVMYETFNGKIAEGLVLDHLCRIRQCINPEHLEPVTNRENILRGEGIAAKNIKKTYCKHGHLLENNVYIFRTSRICRTCQNTRNRAYRNKKLILQGGK